MEIDRLEPANSPTRTPESLITFSLFFFFFTASSYVLVLGQKVDWGKRDFVNIPQSSEPAPLIVLKKTTSTSTVLRYTALT